MDTTVSRPNKMNRGCPQEVEGDGTGPGATLRGGGVEKSIGEKNGEKVWSLGASIPLPPACEAGALPFELRPHFSTTKWLENEYIKSKLGPT